MTDFLFFVEVLVGGLLSGVMYSLVAIGFVLIYKTSGVLNFAQGAMVLFAALTFVSLVERGFPFAGALGVTLAAMVAARLRDRAHGAAAAGQPLADDAVHGDARPVLGSSRARRSCSGAPRCTGSISASTTCRSRSPASSSRPSTSSRRGIAGAMVAAAHRLLPLDPHRPRLPRRRRRPVRGAGGRAAAAADLGHGLDRGRLRRAGRRPALGRAARRAVLAVADRAQGAAGAGARRLRLRSSAPSSAASSIGASREAGRGLYRPVLRRRHRGLVRLRGGAGRAAGPPLRPVRPEAGRSGTEP